MSLITYIRRIYFMTSFIAGQEKMIYGAFMRKYLVFKKSHIPNRIIKLDDEIELPTNSVLHLCDNIADYPGDRDLPKVLTHPLVTNETFKKYISHNTVIPTSKDSIFYVSERYRYIISGMKKTLNDFKKHRKTILPALNIDSVIKRTNVLLVINHNPLWRVKTIGRLQEYKRFEIIFRSILHNVISMPVDKYQYIHIPLSDVIYPRNTYIRAVLDKLDVSTLKYHDDYTYYFMIHLLGFIYEKSKTSLLKKIPEDRLANINFILSYQDNAIVYNLHDLKEIVTNDSIARSVERHISLLKLSKDELDKNINDLSEDEFEYYIEKKAVEKDKEKTTKVMTEEEVGLSKDSTEPASTPMVQDNQESSSIEKQPPVKYEEILDQEVDNLLEDLEDITPKQKDRLKIISKKYIDIKIGDRTIKDILDEDVDDTIVEDELEFLNDLPDTSMVKSSVINMDDHYMEKLFEKDMSQVLTSFATKGIFLVDYKEEKQIDELNKIKKVTAKYEDTKGKTHSVQFKLPIVDKDGTFIINGIKNRMKKQQVNVPICKVSPTRVSLSSNYNKTLVERDESKAHDFYHFINSFINKKANKDSQVVKIKHGNNFHSQKLPYEYTKLGAHYTTMKFGTYTLNFDFENRFDLAKDNYRKVTEELENKYGVYFGTTGKNTEAIYIGLNNVITIVDLKGEEIVKDTTIPGLLFEVTGESVPMVSEWVDLKILDKKIPIIFILAYRYGLTNTLKYLNLNYRTVEKGTRVETSYSELAIKFRDRTIVIDRYPISKSIIVAGLLKYETKDLDYEYFDEKDAYYELLVAKGLSTNYTKGIDDFFDMFVDPITRSVLEQMGEPTNVRDLLIRATAMLTTQYHIDPASMKNHRLRSYERFNAILYNEMARQFVAHRNQKGKDTKFTINPEAVLQRIIQDQSVVIANEINPVQDLKEKTGFTYTGMGGRTPQSFVVADRRFPDDGVGIISEATPDSGKVSITAYTSINPKIKNLRGVFDTDTKDVDPTQILSGPALLMPGATNDDKS